ncbi:hypothetical protein SLNWT_0378 [Streptomyces albus]|uniref:Uncharacterized protein n=1 Tax=Streptomyces albus (strain ATCC 21838 / DSM 41398 / FERM P-419 / JCM 4703 / NBRC 107858) TaxID=1081613 RepID=A0A0B5EH76_STRA4|nr:hypothetical protein SLNWT_0378 [Streptomyces albus]AOU75065.1 hypothetical protein SLNHY_0374 [Streptomyces albus]
MRPAAVRGLRRGGEPGPELLAVGRAPECVAHQGMRCSIQYAIVQPIGLRGQNDEGRPLLTEQEPGFAAGSAESRPVRTDRKRTGSAPGQAEPPAASHRGRA